MFDSRSGRHFFGKSAETRKSLSLLRRFLGHVSAQTRGERRVKKSSRRCKPDSVPRERFRASAVAFIPLNRVSAIPALRRCDIPASIGRAARSPILSCTGLGLSCLLRRRRSGELLPRLFTLTDAFPRRRSVFCDTVRQRALRHAAPVFTGNPALRCPDFPPAGTCVPASECAHLEDATMVGIPAENCNALFLRL